MKKRMIVLGVIGFLIAGYFLTASFVSAQNQAVTFIVPLNSEMTGRTGRIRVKIFNMKNRRAIGQAMESPVSFDMATRTEQRDPAAPGHGNKDLPEAFTFPVTQAGQGPLVFPSKIVFVGDEYRFTITIPYSDGCNSATAVESGRAQAGEIVFENLQWSVTGLGCAR